MAWRTPRTTADDHQRILGDHTARVHMIECRWLDRMLATQLFANRFDAAEFEPYGKDEPLAYVAHHPLRPIAPAEPVGDLLPLHEPARIELRLTGSLWPRWDEVIHSSVGFSGIRLRDATSRS